MFQVSTGDVSTISTGERINISQNVVQTYIKNDYVCTVKLYQGC